MRVKRQREPVAEDQFTSGQAFRLPREKKAAAPKTAEDIARLEEKLIELAKRVIKPLDEMKEVRPFRPHKWVVEAIAEEFSKENPEVYHSQDKFDARFKETSVLDFEHSSLDAAVKVYKFMQTLDKKVITKDYTNYAVHYLAKTVNLSENEEVNSLMGRLKTYRFSDLLANNENSAENHADEADFIQTLNEFFSVYVVPNGKYVPSYESYESKYRKGPVVAIVGAFSLADAVRINTMLKESHETWLRENAAKEQEAAQTA